MGVVTTVDGIFAGLFVGDEEVVDGMAWAW